MIKIKGGSGVVIAENTIFMSSAGAEIIAVDHSNGELKWKFPASEADGEFKGICDIPTLAGDTLYFGSYDGNIYALDMATGKKKWQYPPGDEHIGAIVGAPAISSDTIFFGSADGHVYALNSDTGAEQWLIPFKTGDKIWSSPTISNNVLYVNSSDNKLYAINAISGNELWSFSAEGALINNPTISDGIIYIGSFDNHIYAIDAISGTEKWRYEGGDWFWAQPIVDNGTVYAACMESTYIQNEEHLNDTLFALNARSGELKWKFQTAGAIRTNPIIANGQLIVSSEARNSSKIHIIDLKNGTEISSFPLQHEDGKATPALPPLYIQGNNLYIHTVNVATNKFDDKEWALYSRDITTGKSELIYAYSLN